MELIPNANTKNLISITGLLNRFYRNPSIKAILKSPIFWLFLALKLIFGTCFASTFLRDYFAPFVNYFVDSGFSNPWDYFLNHGEPNKFPYPSFMLYLLAIPRCIFGFILPTDWSDITLATLFVYRLSLIFADFVITILLAHWFPHRIKLVLLVYWCSPLSFYITYWHGQLDVLPTAIFFVSLFLLRKQKILLFALCFAMSLATKSHLWVAFPFISIYLLRRVGPGRTCRLTISIIGMTLILQMPWILSPGYQSMVFGSDEQSRVFSFLLQLGNNGPILFAVPIVLTTLFLKFQSYSKTNFDLLVAYLGIVFCVFVLLSPPRPGYFLWSLPFIVFHYGRQINRNLTSYYLYCFFGLVFFLISNDSDMFDSLGLLHTEYKKQKLSTFFALFLLNKEVIDNIHNLSFGIMFASMVSILISLYTFGVQSNSIHQMRTKPFLIGLAGDSGSGKDTLCHLMEATLGKKRCTTISGDDYHRWPRGHKMWSIHTHLDVRGNDLVKQRDHAIAIARGEGVRKGIYDHVSGNFKPEEWIDPSTYVIFSGLHTLALESQRALYDITIFINPGESLRRTWKVRRDQEERGYSPSEILSKMAEREPDRIKYILPQANHADLVVSFQSKSLSDPIFPEISQELFLEITGSNGFPWGTVVRLLAGVDTLEIEHEGFLSTTRQSIIFRGTISAAIIQTVAEEIISTLDEMSDGPVFEKDLNGCLQLVLLVSLMDKLQ